MRRRVQVGKAFDLSVVVDDEPPEPEKSNEEKKNSSHRRVAVGKPFDAKVVRIDEIELRETELRALIVWIVFGMGAVFLFGAAGLGIHKDEFSDLSHVWSVVGPVYGVIASYFFTHRPRRK
jgi:hypothetical protein